MLCRVWGAKGGLSSLGLCANTKRLVSGKMIAVIEVTAAVIKRGQEILITQRGEDQHLAGYWEFPGGKVEQGESVFAALQRELLEEVNLTVNASEELMVIEHDYGDKCVRLDVHIVDDFTGTAHGAEGQQGKWVALSELDVYSFPAANVEIIEKIKKKYQG